MPITRQSASDVSFSLKIRRDGQYLQNSDGANSLEDFVMACNIKFLLSYNELLNKNTMTTFFVVH